MKIRVERSGGLTGIPICNEMNSNDLPSPLILTAERILEGQKSSSLPSKLTPKGAADQYIYKISISDGLKHSVIKCDQYTIEDDLSSLVKYIEKNSKK